ncbi:SDR family NAD(P)-dependent oxidoreductase [Nonomuraea sp. LPB2021202275-12-8]|uniref:SDR family NAD(P)-dependent oxidoreductase n=1 Tax=Nonomuraea sp. LPB2021202275-12-8 TaxID=3120159 RepID=UPI00300D16E7
MVITGGTSGIGLALARHRAGLGDRVVAVGSSEEGGRRLREEVPQAHFIRSDLSSLRRTRDLTERLGAEYPVIDTLVLAAFRLNPARVETAEGFEHTFALYVINRWLMAEGLRDGLERSPAPAIVNLCGAGQRGRIHWDDLQLAGGYRAVTATMQGARANELLGMAYTAERTKYVLYNPVFVATGLHEPFKQPLRGVVRAASAAFAQPVARALPPIAALVDRPPGEPLTAWKQGKPIDLAVDLEEARRFERTVRELASALPC